MKVIWDRLVIPAAAVLVLGNPAPGYGQSSLIGARAAKPVLEVVPDQAPEWGGASQTIHKVSITDFRSSDVVSALGYVISAGGISFSQTDPAFAVPWLAQAKLPSGAIIESVQLDACDDSATGEFWWGLTRTTAGGTGASDVTPTGTTGYAATPGCAFFSVSPLSPPLVVDNENFNYWVFLYWRGEFTSALRAAGVRIRYRLQVSPAPGVATFSDVPTTHPYFKFVEALYAAGITVGCGGGKFCPDAPATRGQIAVFLASALGLHWPN